MLTHPVTRKVRPPSPIFPGAMCSTVDLTRSSKTAGNLFGAQGKKRGILRGRGMPQLGCPVPVQVRTNEQTYREAYREVHTKPITNHQSHTGYPGVSWQHAHEHPLRRHPYFFLDRDAEVRFTAFSQCCRSAFSFTSTHPASPQKKYE